MKTKLQKKKKTQQSLHANEANKTTQARSSTKVILTCNRGNEEENEEAEEEEKR